MAAGDYVVRRNNANTDELVDAGSDLLLLWDTAVANVGAGITYDTGVFTLGETGRFLVICSDQYGTTDTTANQRTNPKTTFTLAGSELTEGFSSGFIRRSGGSQEFINHSIAYVNVATTTGNGDDLEVRHERIDTATTGTVNRIADRSGISILKLEDTWNFAHYRSSAAFTPSATDHVRNTADIGSTVEQDGSIFSRTGNVVTVTTTNPVLAVYTFYNDQADTHSGRTEMQGVLDFDFGEEVRSWSQTYGPRATQNSDYGGMSMGTVLYPNGEGQPLELVLVSREDADEDWFAELQLIELPATAATAAMERSTAAGNYNAAGTDFVWETLRGEIDTDIFTATGGNANIDVDVEGDYLVFANLGTITDAGYTGSGTRAIPALGVTVNATEQTHIGNSSYNRNNGTAEHAHSATGGLLTGLSANDTIQAHANRIGTNSNTLVAAGGMTVIQWDSLFGVAAQSLTPSGASVSVTAGTLTMTTGPADLTPAGASVSASQERLLSRQDRPL